MSLKPGRCLKTARVANDTYVYTSFIFLIRNQSDYYNYVESKLYYGTVANLAVSIGLAALSDGNGGELVVAR